MAQPPYGQPPQHPENQPPYGQPSPYGQQQPQYGQAPPQYGQQPQYGQPQYGQPQYGAPGQYPGPGGYGPQPKQGNGFSVAGVCLCVIPLLGLIFSIIGVVKSKARGGAGKTLGIVGIVLSILFAVGYGVASASIGGSTAADPGCISAEASSRQLVNQMQSDSGNMTKMQSDMQSLESGLQHAQSIAVHQSVKDAIGKMASDLTGMTNALNAMQKGDTSQGSAVENYAKKLGPDGDTIDRICTPFGGSSSSGS